MKPLLLAIRQPQELKVIKSLDKQIEIQLQTIIRDEMLHGVIEELKALNPYLPPEPPHGKNEYFIVHKNPKEPKTNAEELVAIQLIPLFPLETKPNDSHNHSKQNRVEVIRCLQGKIKVFFHDPESNQIIEDDTVTLTPNKSVIILPHQQHSVKRVGHQDSICLILGFQLER